MKTRFLIVSLAALLVCAAAGAQRYCNPLPMPVGQGGSAGGDVTVLETGGKYYMCCTGGGMWVSDDLLNWEFTRVEHVPSAPDLVEYNGKFYVTAYGVDASGVFSYDPATDSAEQVLQCNTDLSYLYIF